MTNLVTKPLNHPGTFTVGYLLCRLLLFPLTPVPGAVALDPLWLFALLLRQRGGRGWMFSLIPGLVFGDWMCGMAGPQILMRLAGFVALGLLPLDGGFNRKYFFYISAFALWSSLMPDWRGWYPLGYLYAVWVLQGLLWWGLAAPSGKDGGSLSPILPLLVIPVGLALLHFLPGAPELWPVPRLGNRSGLTLRILAGLLLLPPFVGWWLRRRRPKPSEDFTANGPGRWTHLAE